LFEAAKTSVEPKAPLSLFSFIILSKSIGW